MSQELSEHARRLYAEIMDSLDEELEMEIDDERYDAILQEAGFEHQSDSMDRRYYFRELLRLQCELVKLQDWVVNKKLKVVVIFEGRDAAGKGGAIKRITQRLNPRVCRVAALPVPNGISNVMFHTCPQVAKSYYLTVAGITVPVSSV